MTHYLTYLKDAVGNNYVGINIPEAVVEPHLEKLKDKPFIFFLNKVSLGYLYYQFLTAVRKDTRK